MRIAGALFVALSACGGNGVSWGPVTYGAAPPEPRIESATLPGRTGAGCAEVAIAARGEARYAAWWEARPDGSSALMLARSPDGGAHWDTPLVADGRDAADLGCARPLPAVFADETTEYLHVTYHIAPRGSPGVYFTHSMNAAKLAASGEGVLHMAVPVTHGDRPVRSSVAGRGDTVVVAFEDPNSAKPRILLAISTGAGHVFSPHEVVSPAGSAASAPRVAIAGDSVHVRWVEATADGTVRQAARSGALP
jgi:hypothetical protein